jgi:hypothetical protein
MELSSIILSQAIRFGKVTGIGGGVIYGLNLAKACEERYGFLQAPRVLADYDLNKGITFLHGYFEKAVIDKFQIFPNGVLAEAQVDTDNCDRFLDDILKWVTERGGIEFTPPDSTIKAYFSQIEVKFDVALESYFKLTVFGKHIADILRGYGQTTSDYIPSGLSFGAQPSDTLGFKFEGREGAPPGLFFSQARMRTKDHLSALEMLRSLL